MNNYLFNTKLIQKLDSNTAIRILDFGCGGGKIVENLLNAGYENVYGCDIFFDGGNFKNEIRPDLLNTHIFDMKDGKIPFKDESFDIVSSNMVIEHVEDLDFVLNEIYRVLRPGGKIISVFPDKSIWREGHCGIPFLHMFPKKSTFRIYYTYFCRLIGLGYPKGEMTSFEWSKYICNYLDLWTHYRTQKNLDLAFEKFREKKNYEVLWVNERLSANKYLKNTISIIPNFVKTFITRKFAHLVFVYKK
jgi:SAM-dependent methyltransferase